ncbi:MAG: hypothetical protein BGO78_17800 [Chloroflexi bacterium 44-23]|nr:MAG: hypothetical protein BGO78_17800 [Chloroflexi bacterium 44-23]
MKTQSYPKLKNILITTAFLAAVGWLGLYFLFQYTTPLLGPRWLFFFLFMVALSGTSLPIVYFFNLRFISSPPANAIVLIRQAIWVGLFFDLLAWLQLGRILNPVLALILAIGILVVENLIRMAEISRWRPEVDEDE